tara:strand:- start:67 stop:303 length:237 start_codon:yes stop_codon:yes gene_type:complete
MIDAFCDLIETPEGVWVPAIGSNIETLADGRMVRNIYVQSADYLCVRVDLRDETEEWMQKVDIQSPPIEGQKTKTEEE